MLTAARSQTRARKVALRWRLAPDSVLQCEHHVEDVYGYDTSRYAWRGEADRHAEQSSQKCFMSVMPAIRCSSCPVPFLGNMGP
eukprot:jgi/Chrzof1/1054/Cz01g38190.t1